MRNGLSRATVGIALLLLTGACAGSSQSDRPRPTAKAAKAVLTDKQFLGVLADYDRRNNAAVKAMQSKPDPAVWAASTSGVALAASQLSTKYLLAKGSKYTGTPQRTTLTALYASTFTRYPARVLATTQDAEDAENGEDDLRVWSKSCASCSWKVANSVPVEHFSLSGSRDVGRDSVPTLAQRQVAGGVRDDLTQYLKTGTSAVITPTDGLKETRRDLTAAASYERTIFKVEPNPKTSIFLVRVADGALAVIEHSYTTASFAKNGTLAFDDKAYARALGQPGDRDQLSQSGVLTSVVLIPDQRTPELITTDNQVTGP